jgi:hypothetical protein
LAALVIVADLNAPLDAEYAADPAFRVNWDTATDWSEKDRYVEHSEQKATGLYQAITDRKHGVMRWIRRYW